jgi:hypothetical protein
LRRLGIDIFKNHAVGLWSRCSSERIEHLIDLVLLRLDEFLEL